MKKQFKVFFSIAVIGFFLAAAFASGESKESSNLESESKDVIKTSFKDGDELFDYVSFGYYSYDDLVKMWGEAEVGEPYLNDRNDGFNVSVKWNKINVGGYVPIFEFSVWTGDGKSPLTFKGVSVNDYVFEY